VTNPTIEVHKEFARIEFLQEYNKPNQYIKELVGIVTDEKVYSESYFFFSLTKFDDLGTIKTIGVGIFGHIIPYYCLKEHKEQISVGLIATLLTIKLIFDLISSAIIKKTI
jgi:hypothetical protein